MGVYIPNMDKPQNITRCSYKINPEECKCIYTDKVFEETLALIMDHPCPDCPLIEIDDTVWENEKYKLIRMTQAVRINKEMAERRSE